MDIQRKVLVDDNTSFFISQPMYIADATNVSLQITKSTGATGTFQVLVGGQPHDAPFIVGGIQTKDFQYKPQLIRASDGTSIDDGVIDLATDADSFEVNIERGSWLRVSNGDDGLSGNTAKFSVVAVATNEQR